MLGKDDTQVAPKDRIQTFLNAARVGCMQQRDHHKFRTEQIKTAQLKDPDMMVEFETRLSDQNRYQFAIEQIELLMRYLT